MTLRRKLRPQRVKKLEKKKSGNCVLIKVWHLFMSRASLILLGQSMSSVISILLWSTAAIVFIDSTAVEGFVSVLVYSVVWVHIVLCQICSPFHQCKLWTVLMWNSVDNSFFVVFFCCRPCLHKKGPDGDHCSLT